MSEPILSEDGFWELVDNQWVATEKQQFALVNVFEWAKFQYLDEDDFILLGDLNADCNYASSSELDELDIRNGDYQWIIPDGTNTNIAESSSCAYDRMIIGDGGSGEYLGSFSTDCELESSDHCIISAKFSAHEK